MRIWCVSMRINKNRRMASPSGNATSKSCTKKTYCLSVVSFQCVLRCPLTAADMEKHSFTFICNSLTHCTACNSLCVMWGRRADVFIYCGRHVPLICIHFIQICSVHLLVEKPNMYSKILTQQQKCRDTNQFSSDNQKIIASSCQ